MKCTRQLDKPLFAIAVLIGGFFSALRGVTTITPADDFANAVAAMQPGDTLILRGGTYPMIDSNSTKIPSGTSWSDAPKITSYSGETAVISGMNLAFPSGVGQSSCRYLIFDGIDFVPRSGSDGVSLWGAANHIRFQNFNVHGSRNGKMGVNIQPGNGGGGSNEFINGRVYDNIGYYGGGASSGTTAHGMYVGSSNNLIANVEIFGNGQHGLQVYSEHVTPSGNAIRSCNVHNNGVTYRDYWVGIVVGGGNGNQVLDSTIYNEMVGIKICCRQPSGALIQNNKVYNNSAFDIEIQSSSTAATVKDNCATKISDSGSGTRLDNNSGSSCGVQSSTAPPPVIDTYTLPADSSQTSESVQEGNFGGLGTAAMILGLGFLFVFLTD